MNKIFVAGVVLLIIVLGAWQYSNSDTGGTAPVITWEFKDITDAASLTPITAVTILVDGTPREIGNLEGSCSAIGDSSWTLLPGEYAGAICYFAGGGTEIGVFKEGEGYVVKQGMVEEGDAEIPGSRANFTTLFTL